MTRWGFGDEDWAQKVLELQDLLVDAARRRGTVTYGEIARRVFDGRVLPRSSAVMALVDEACDALDEGRGTVMASLVVRADTGMPGEGYFSWAQAAGYVLGERDVFWREQAERVWDSWADESPRPEPDPELRASEGRLD